MAVSILIHFKCIVLKSIILFHHYGFFTPFLEVVGEEALLKLECIILSNALQDGQGSPSRGQGVHTMNEKKPFTCGRLHVTDKRLLYGGWLITFVFLKTCYFNRKQHRTVKYCWGSFPVPTKCSVPVFKITWLEQKRILILFNNPAQLQSSHMSLLNRGFSFL